MTTGTNKKKSIVSDLEYLTAVFPEEAATTLLLSGELLEASDEPCDLCDEINGETDADECPFEGFHYIS